MPGIDDLLTAKQVATQIGITRDSLTRIARAHAIGRIVGTGYLFTGAEANRLRSLAHSTSGNPLWIAKNHVSSPNENP